MNSNSIPKRTYNSNISNFNTRFEMQVFSIFQGVITGCIFLILTIVMIPFTLVNEDGTSIITRNSLDIEDVEELKLLFPSQLLTYRQLLQLGMALLSICCMVLLGFADDVLGKPHFLDNYER